MLCIRVDDVLWAVEPGDESHIDSISNGFEVKEIGEDKFRFCGCEIVQDVGGTVKVACGDTAERIYPIKFAITDVGLDEEDTDSEISQLGSVVGGLSWISRQARPPLSYIVSHLQSFKRTASVRDLKDCNAAVREADRRSSDGIVYKGGAVDPDI